MVCGAPDFVNIQPGKYLTELGTSTCNADMADVPGVTIGVGDMEEWRDNIYEATVGGRMPLHMHPFSQQNPDPDHPL